MKINELSTQKLAQYKTAAGKDARAADKEGDYKRGDKRFSGIVKATKKQFDNETKPKEVEEGQIYFQGGGGPQAQHWYKPRHVPNQDELEKMKKESAIMKGIQNETLGMPYPGTYEQETKPLLSKGQKRTQAIAFE